MTAGGCSAGCVTAAAARRCRRRRRAPDRAGRAGRPRRRAARACWVERAGQLPWCVVTLLPLHLEGLVEQSFALQVVEHEVEQVDVLDPQTRLLLGDVVEQEADVLPDPQLVFRRVIEDVEGDLVAEAAAAQEVVGGDPGQNLVQRSVSGSLMGPPGCSAGRTLRRGPSGNRAPGTAMWTVCSLRVRVFSM